MKTKQKKNIIPLCVTGYFFLLSKNIQETHPELALLVVKKDPVGYYHLSDKIKESNWELALAATSRTPYTYCAVPENMRNFETSRDHRAIELAQLASKFKQHTISDFVEQGVNDPEAAYKEAVLSRGNHISNADMGFQHMSPATRNGLLEHLYNTGEHTHLRDLSRFKDARHRVAELHAQKEHEISLAARRQGLFSKLSKDTREHIASFIKNKNSLQRDHALWCDAEIIRLEYCIDIFMSEYYIEPRTTIFDAHEAFVLQFLTFFCDSRYAMSLEYTDAPRDDAVLVPEVAEKAAHAIWHWLAIMLAASPENTQPVVRERLIQLGFQAPVDQVDEKAVRFLGIPQVNAQGQPTIQKLFSEFI